MLLTELMETIVAYLNSDKEAWNMPRTPPEDYVEASVELDPMLCLLPQLGVYIVPVFAQPNIEASGTRHRVISLTEDLTFNLIVSKAFEDLPQDDTKSVANWDEAKEIVDVRQKAERYIVGWEPGKLQLLSVETNELEEVELDVRNFVAMTSFTYRQSLCL